MVDYGSSFHWQKCCHWKFVGPRVPQNFTCQPFITIIVIERTQGHLHKKSLRDTFSALPLQKAGFARKKINMKTKFLHENILSIRISRDIVCKDTFSDA